jgi:BolA family transcriptional regulator, general stress-responsive regulator
MSVTESIKVKLTDALAPLRLEVINESHLHEGHAGWREGGESHFRVIVVAGGFAGLSRVERQRLVHGALAEELAGPVHALSIRAIAPGEAGA